MITITQDPTTSTIAVRFDEEPEQFQDEFTITYQQAEWIYQQLDMLFKGSVVRQEAMANVELVRAQARIDSLLNILTTVIEVKANGS